MAKSAAKDNYDNERVFLRELLIACEKDELDKVKSIESELQAKHSNISICDYKDGKKSGAVHAAARAGATRTLEYLLTLRPEQGALRDAENRTPLMAACIAESGAPCVKYLLQSNSFARDSVEVDSNGVRAIHMAASLDTDESLQYLLELGKADPNSPSIAGFPIHWASGHASNEKTCRVLVETGKIDVNARDGQGCTPIILASLRGMPKIVQYLCDVGADLKLFAHNLCALGAAAASGSKPCVQILLKKGGDELCLSRDPVENLLPIDVAAHSGHEEIVELLGPHSGMKGVNAAQLIKEAQETFDALTRKSEEERQAADDIAAKIKEEGNQLFLQQKFDEAIAKYDSALQHTKQSPAVKATLLSNISACYLKLGRGEQACNTAKQAIEADKKFVKGYFRLGQACSSLKDHEGAAHAFWEAYELNKQGVDAQNFLTLFKKEIELGKKAYALQQQQKQ